MNKSAKISMIGDPKPETPQIKVPITSNTSNEEGSDVDWMSLLMGGGGALLGHSIASSMMDDPNEDRGKRSMWSKVLEKLIPIGVGAAGAYGGYELGKLMKNGSGENVSTNSPSAADLWRVRLDSEDGSGRYKDFADLSDALDNQKWNYWRYPGAVVLGGDAIRNFMLAHGNFKDWRMWNPDNPNFSPVSVAGIDKLKSHNDAVNANRKYQEDVSAYDARNDEIDIVKKKNKSIDEFNANRGPKDRLKEKLPVPKKLPSPVKPSQKPNSTRPRGLYARGVYRRARGGVEALASLALAKGAINARNRVSDWFDFASNWGKFKNDKGVETNVGELFNNLPPQKQNEVLELAKKIRSGSSAASK